LPRAPELEGRHHPDARKIFKFSATPRNRGADKQAVIGWHFSGDRRALPRFSHRSSSTWASKIPQATTSIRRSHLRPEKFPACRFEFDPIYPRFRDLYLRRGTASVTASSRAIYLLAYRGSRIARELNRTAPASSCFKERAQRENNPGSLRREARPHWARDQHRI